MSAGLQHDSRLGELVRKLTAAIDEGTYLPRAFDDIALDCSSVEVVELLRILGVTTERAELLAERRRELGERFLEGDAQAQDAALLEWIPELAGDGGEDELALV